MHFSDAWKYVSLVLRSGVFAAALLCQLLPGHARQDSNTFEVPMQRWYRREYKLRPVIERVPYSKTDGFKLSVDFARVNEFYMDPRKAIKNSFHGWDSIEWRIVLPKDFPKDAQLYVFGKSWDSEWFQQPVALPKDLGKPFAFTLPLSGPQAAKSWLPSGHYRKWRQLTPKQLIEFGLKFENPKGKQLKWKGQVSVLGLLLHRTEDNKTKYQIHNLSMTPAKPRVGDMVEIRFELTHPYTRPFDRTDVNIAGELIQPDGETKMIHGFYFLDFLQDGKDKFAAQIPYGPPQFRLRFTPTMLGDHILTVAGRLGKSDFILPEFSFKVTDTKKGWKGFIRRMPGDSRLLCYSSGNKEFWGQGMNVRSPFDTRYKDAFPSTKWDPFNLNMYKDLFKKYHQSGINVVEIWMSSWWLGLEWIPDAPGNHGIGHMNQWRAWKLDKILEWADEYDIYIILAINNHGKFSTWCDQEWSRNPFNRVNGGYLRQPNEFFSNRRAMVDFRRLADYLTARWGYSSRILAWKLFTEIDLTGVSAGAYTRFDVASWHRQAAHYLNMVDPNRHLVTTHWSGSYQVAQRSPVLANTKELEILTLDAYYLGLRGTYRFYTNLVGTEKFQQSVKKPCIITEFGGTPWADNLPHLEQQIHLGLWFGFFGGFPCTPCLWWFPLADERNLYSHYKALHAFTKGETRIDARYTHIPLGSDQRCLAVNTKNSAYYWIFDSQYFFNNNRLHEKGRLCGGASLPLTGLKRGKYVVEFWNCSIGKVIRTTTVNVTGNADKLRVPPFRRDIAAKLKYQP